MLHFVERRGHMMGLGLLTAIGLALSGALLTVWMFALLAVIVVPAVLIAFVTAQTARWLDPRKSHPPQGQRIIEGEYEILDSGTG